MAVLRAKLRATIEAKAKEGLQTCSSMFRILKKTDIDGCRQLLLCTFSRDPNIYSTGVTIDIESL